MERDDELQALRDQVATLEARLSQLEDEHEPGILKVAAEARNVYGWAYVAQDRQGGQIVDISGDVVDDPAELEKAAAKFVSDYRVGRVAHTGEPTMSVIESVTYTPAKLEKMGIPAGTLPTGWWVGFHVNDDKAWEDIKSGRMRAFSIGGRGKRDPIFGT